MATDLKSMIHREAGNLTVLRETVLDCVAGRDSSEQGLRRWAEAVRSFHAYESEMDELVNRACSVELCRYSDVAEFALCFLEVDPMFFRSGFIKQEIMRRVHRAPFDTDQKLRLRAVLIDAATRRGTREYRHYCKVAARVADAELTEALSELGGSADASVRSRASMMLDYVARQFPDRNAA